MNFVYLTTNNVNGKQYVGSHSGEENDDYLGSGKIILKAIKKYNKENFKREILEINDTILESRKLEVVYIEKYDTIFPNGYNLSPTGGNSHQGGKLSEDHKQKIRIALKGKKRDPKIGQKIKETRIKNNSYHISEEQKEKIRNTLTGRIKGPCLEETKKKIRLGNIGKKKTEMSKKKMSIAKQGIELSEEHKHNLSINNAHYWKDKNLSEEHKQKLSESHKGKKQKRIICEYCGKDIAVNMYARYHGNKCKNNNNK